MEQIFSGLYTALITPFSEDGSINQKELLHLIDLQINANIDGIVILGTTGESPTITASEQKDLINLAINHIDNRCKVIIGTGTNSTKTTIENSIYAEKVGADGLLIVNPYYNRPTQKGLYQHFSAVAHSVQTPIILYNILGRTGVNIETPTLLKLATIPNIMAVKEASGNIEQIREVIRIVPSDFAVLSGDDSITYELMKSGGHGLVSVMSNLLPKQMKEFIDICSVANWHKAKQLSENLSPLFTASLMETNPQPVKTMMANVNLCKEVFRLPLTSMETSNKEKLLSVWNNWFEQFKIKSFDDTIYLKS